MIRSILTGTLVATMLAGCATAPRTTGLQNTIPEAIAAAQFVQESPERVYEIEPKDPNELIEKHHYKGIQDGDFEYWVGFMDNDSTTEGIETIDELKIIVSYHQMIIAGFSDRGFDGIGVSDRVIYNGRRGLPDNYAEEIEECNWLAGEPALAYFNLLQRINICMND